MYQEELKISVTHIYITKLPGWYPILEKAGIDLDEVILYKKPRW